MSTINRPSVCKDAKVHLIPPIISFDAIPAIPGLKVVIGWGTPVAIAGTRAGLTLWMTSMKCVERLTFWTAGLSNGSPIDALPPIGGRGDS